MKSWIFLTFLFFGVLNCVSPVEKPLPESQSPPPNSTQPPVPPKKLLPWQTVDLAKLLVPRKLIEFTLSGNIGGKKDKYRDNLHPTDEYVMSRYWTEPYAGTFYRFLLGKYSTFEQFVETTNLAGDVELLGASKFDPTFVNADSFHDAFTGGAPKPLLPKGSGLGRIIAAAIIGCENDFKGFNSADSNFGVVEHGGKKYYMKIDHGQSFYFNHRHMKDVCDLSQLKDPKDDMPFLKRWDFKGPFKLNQDQLDEIKEAALEFAAIPPDLLNKVLDFSEGELRKLPKYPEEDNQLGVSKKARPFPGSGHAQGVFKKGDYPKGGFKTFKDAINFRFQQLRKLLK